MPHFRWFATVLTLFSLSLFCVAQDDQQDPDCRLPEVRRELLSRVEVDQTARNQLIKHFSAKDSDGIAARNSAIQLMKKVDADNFQWLNEQVAQHGWLGASAVGKDGANAAWLLVQHCDANPKFQRQCLDLMTAMPANEVSQKNLAYLTDRVLKAEGKPMLYGTQLDQINGRFVVGDVTEPDELDERRAAMGLESMTEYIQMAEQAYGLAAQSNETKTLDAHVHMLSPTLVKGWKDLGVPFSREAKFYSDPAAVLELINTDQAIVVSMAYLYGRDGFQQLDSVKENEEAVVSAENDFIANCVKESEGQLIGFFAAHPLKDYSDREFSRCQGVAELTGLKLHLPACDVSLLDDDHLDRIATIFRWCESNKVPVLIHLAGVELEGFGAVGAKRFWSEVVEPVPEINLIIAHCGASGGFGANSAAILNGFDELRKRNSAFEKAEIYFDLSGAILFKETEGLPPTSDAQCQSLTERMREIGLSRFLPASDYPAFDHEEMFNALKEKLSLSDEELGELFRNRPGFLK